jgi:hypothetical protein
VSISSIGIQTVTPSTGTKADQQTSRQQQSAANDNSAQAPAKSGSSRTTGQYVDKRV